MGSVQFLAKQARRVGKGLMDEVPSPCVSVCRMDPVSELCEGCFRTLDEIADWSRMDDDGKRGVWRAIGERIAVGSGEDGSPGFPPARE
jgi:predicted Fe-S protein YdhL (DUF1289 family)